MSLKYEPASERDLSRSLLPHRLFWFDLPTNPDPTNPESINTSKVDVLSPLTFLKAFSPTGSSGSA